MKKEEFDKALKYCDFSLGDTFWLNGIEFEVINKEDNLPIK